MAVKNHLVKNGRTVCEQVPAMALFSALAVYYGDLGSFSKPQCPGFTLDQLY